MSPPVYAAASEVNIARPETTATRCGVTESLPLFNWPGCGVQRKWSNLEGADAFISSMVGLALAAPG